jgi:hypothetical protein
MKARNQKQTDPLVRVESTDLLCVGKSPLEEWVDQLADEVATVKVVACFYAPDKPHYHGCLIGITGDGATMPFFGCRTQAEVDADLEDRRVRYAGKFVSHNSSFTTGTGGKVQALYSSHF